MNKQLLTKIGPIAGLVATLSTTGFAGAKIFAAPAHHQVVAAASVSSASSPTPTDEPPEIVEQVVYDTPAPKPVVPPANPTTPPIKVAAAVSAGLSASTTTPSVAPIASLGISGRGDDSGEDGNRVSVTATTRVRTANHETESDN